MTVIDSVSPAIGLTRLAWATERPSRSGSGRTCEV
jgi:hypothetical protein